jgi:DNA-binding CsgD family transcriptional regulator
MSDDSATLAALAADCTTQDEWRSAALAELQRWIGFDYGVVWTPGQASGVVNGFDVAFLRRVQARGDTFADDVQALVAGALQRGGVGVDCETLDARRRDRSAFYREIIWPVGSRGFLTVPLCAGGEIVAMMQLGRGNAQAARFEDVASRERLAHVRAIFALAERAHAPTLKKTDAIAASDLTAREQEVVRYLTLGFTNKEIALACGTSANTVKNQLAAAFKKANVSTRAELTAWALSPPENEPRSPARARRGA